MGREAGGGQLLNSQTRAVTVFFLAFAAFAVANVIVWRDRPSSVVWGLLAGALCVFSAVRTSRSAISWDSNGVVSRDTGRTRRFAWSEIADFDHDEFRGLGALLASGRRARLMSFPTKSDQQPGSCGRHVAGSPGTAQQLDLTACSERAAQRLLLPRRGLGAGLNDVGVGDDEFAL